MYEELYSECCYAKPLGQVDDYNPEIGITGVCSYCKDNTVFYTDDEITSFEMGCYREEN